MQTQTLKLTRIKESIFTVAFTALAVYTPMLAHYFGGVSAGRTFLPMHFFVLVAGLLLGWRAGLIAGLATPLISYLISGMPMMNLLPFIVIELAVYGLIGGLIKEKVGLNIWLSLIGALVAGRIALFAFLFFFSDMNALNYLQGAVLAGWQGIALQVLLIPVAVKMLGEYFKN